MPTPTKRIIIACDGTWQSSTTETDNIPSNVTKLCRHIARKSSPNGIPQIVYYDSGIGTGDLTSFEKKRAGGTGAGLATNVIEAYNFIALNYSPGDEIFCFGFSRGAYTARSVAGLVTDIGVLEARNMGIFPKLYRAYKANRTGKDFRTTDAWKEFEKEVPEDRLAIPESNNVKVVGVWDTVGSLGVPDGRWVDNSDKRTEFGFHNVKLNGRIEHAFHALALDERRKAFKPTLWYLPKDHQNKTPELLQVWFPGVHINVGGGSDDGVKKQVGDLEGMANITFAWMLQCIAPYLTIDTISFQHTMTEYKLWLDSIEHCEKPHHEDTSGWYNKAWSYVPHIPYVNPAPVHEEHRVDRGWGTGRVQDSLTGAMYLWAGGEKRIPGKCKTEIYNSTTKEFEWKEIEDMGDTNEFIHPVAAYRKDQFGVEANSGLDGFERKKRAGGQGWQWTNEKLERVVNGKKVKLTVPEFVIPKTGDNFERLWMDADGESEKERQWLEMVDRENGL